MKRVWQDEPFRMSRIIRMAIRVISTYSVANQNHGQVQEKVKVQSTDLLHTFVMENNNQNIF